jgi:hypothetical protein
MPKIAIASACLALAAIPSVGEARVVDQIVPSLTDRTTVERYSLSNAIVTPGPLSQAGIILNPPATPGWRGGSVTIALRVQPDAPNFLSVRLWGGSAADGNPSGEAPKVAAHWRSIVTGAPSSVSSLAAITPAFCDIRASRVSASASSISSPPAMIRPDASVRR